MPEENDNINFKKNAKKQESSIFASLHSSSESLNPFPSSSSLSASSSSSDINVLNQKLENMEKNILKTIESKIKQQLEQNIPEKKTQDNGAKFEVLLKKIEQMEIGLKEFQEKTLFPPPPPPQRKGKVAEEFGLSVRKEMDGFIKILRDLHKSSEDAASKDGLKQLKDLLEDRLSFFESATKKSSDSQASLTVDGVSKRTEKIIEAKLKTFFDPLSSLLKRLSVKEAEIESKNAANKEELRQLKDMFENRLVFFETAVKELAENKGSLTIDSISKKTEKIINAKLKMFFDPLDTRLKVLSGKAEETKSAELETGNDLRKMSDILENKLAFFESELDELKTVSNKMAKKSEGFALEMKAKLEEDCSKVVKDIGNKFSTIISGERESTLNEHYAEFQCFLDDLKTKMHVEVKDCFKGERDFLKEDMGELSLNVRQECKKLNEIQKSIVNNASESKTQLKGVIKDYFSGERELFRKDMADIALKFDGEYKKLGEIQNTALDGVAETQSDLRNMIKRYFIGENELLKKIKNIIAEGENSFLEKAEIDNKNHILKIKECCERTGRDMFSVEAVSYHLDELRDKLFNIGRNLSQFIKEVDGMGLEPVLGTAGIKMKRELESLRHNLVELQSETASFDNLEHKIDKAMGNISKPEDKPQ